MLSDSNSWSLLPDCVIAYIIYYIICVTMYYLLFIIYHLFIIILPLVNRIKSAKNFACVNLISNGNVVSKSRWTPKTGLKDIRSITATSPGTILLYLCLYNYLYNKQPRFQLYHIYLSLAVSLPRYCICLTIVHVFKELRFPVSTLHYLVNSWF